MSLCCRCCVEGVRGRFSALHSLASLGLNGSKSNSPNPLPEVHFSFPSAPINEWEGTGASADERELGK
jgi:hypothetical protein